MKMLRRCWGLLGRHWAMGNSFVLHYLGEGVALYGVMGMEFGLFILHLVWDTIYKKEIKPTPTQKSRPNKHTNTYACKRQ